MIYFIFTQTFVSLPKFSGRKTKYACWKKQLMSIILSFKDLSNLLGTISFSLLVLLVPSRNYFRSSEFLFLFRIVGVTILISSMLVYVGSYISFPFVFWLAPSPWVRVYGLRAFMSCYHTLGVIFQGFIDHWKGFSILFLDKYLSRNFYLLYSESWLWRI